MAADPVVLMYHGLDPGDGRYRAAPAGQMAYVLKEEAFCDHLNAIVEADRRMVDPERLTREERHPLEANDVALTFDDNDLSNYDVALPILLDAGLKAFFFISAGLVGRPGQCDWDHWREIAAAGMPIGSHGLTHRFLTTLDRDEQRRELTESRLLIEDELGQMVDAVAFPGGRYNRQTFDLIAECGYRTVFTSSPQRPTRLDGFEVVGRVPVRATWDAAHMRDFLTNQRHHVRRMRRSDVVRHRLQQVLGDENYAAFHHFVWHYFIR